jgi:hypothetical protein
MEDNGYPAVNSEKTIFMKRTGDNDFIIHGLFVDDIKSVPTKKALLDEFIAKYSKEFEITGGKLMTQFLGLSVEQSNHCISLHLDPYIRETIGRVPEIHWESSPTEVNTHAARKRPGAGGLSTRSRSEEANHLPIDSCPPAVRRYMGTIRHLVHGGATGPILCVGRSEALGSAAPRDGVPLEAPQLEAGVPEDHIVPERPRRLLRCRLG